jgi:hypothetical protein
MKALPCLAVGVLVAILIAIPGASGAAPRLAAAAVTPQGFVGVTPTRVLDTRAPAVGVATPAPLGPSATVVLPLTTVAPNRSGIPVPSGATSVLLNVTVDADATASSFITVWPTGKPRPTTSVIDPKPGTVTSGSILVPLGTGGDVSIFNYAGLANVIVDLDGYTTPLGGGQGPPGPRGLTGPPGPAGPSSAFTAPQDSLSVSLSPSFGVVLSLRVPAGTYVFMATALLTSDSSATSDDLCYFFESNLGVPHAGVNLGAAPDSKMVTLNWAVTLTSPLTTVSLQCEIANGGAAEAALPTLIGIKVDSLTQQ